MELASYALGAISTVFQTTTYPVVLSLPICGTAMHLHVCFVINGKLCDIQVTECNFAYSDDGTRKFLAKLYVDAIFISDNIPIDCCYILSGPNNSGFLIIVLFNACNISSDDFFGIAILDFMN